MSMKDEYHCVPDEKRNIEHVNTIIKEHAPDRKYDH